MTEITLQRHRGFEMDRPYLDYTLTVRSDGSAAIISDNDPEGKFSAAIQPAQFKKLAGDLVTSGFFGNRRSSGEVALDSATFTISSVRSGKRIVVFDGDPSIYDPASRRLQALETEMGGLTTSLHWVKTGSSTKQPRFYASVAQ